MFESLSEKLQAVFERLGRKGRLSEEDVELALREVRVALLEADVSLKVVRQFVAAVKEKAVGQDVGDEVSRDAAIVGGGYDGDPGVLRLHGEGVEDLLDVVFAARLGDDQARRRAQLLIDDCDERLGGYRRGRRPSSKGAGPCRRSRATLHESDSLSALAPLV